MFKALRKYRYVIITTILILAAFVGYQFFFAGSGSDALLVSESGTSDSQVAAEGQQLVSLLEELREIQLDTEIFGNPAFQKLQDFGQDISDEPIGRENPFAPSQGVTQPQQ